MFLLSYAVNCPGTPQIYFVPLSLTTMLTCGVSSDIPAWAPMSYTHILFSEFFKPAENIKLHIPQHHILLMKMSHHY